MRPFLLALAALLLGLIMPQAALAAGNIYYVDAVSGADTNSGRTENQAWKTLARVNAQTFQPGDKIFLKAGCEFPGSLVLRDSGTAENPICLGRYGEGKNPHIAGNTGTGRDGIAILMQDTAYWELSSLEITNPNGRMGIWVNKNKPGVTSHLYFRDLEIHNVRGQQPAIENRDFGGMLFNNSPSAEGRFDDILISGCKIYDIKVIGIQMQARSAEASYRATNTRIERTDIYDCGQDGVIWRNANGAVIEYCRAYRTGLDKLRATVGIWLKYNTGSVIQYCEAFENTDPNIDGHGFDLDMGCEDCIVQYNYSHDNDGGFLLICSDTLDNKGNIARYNISKNDGGNCFSLNGGVSNVQIYNNTIYADKNAGMNFIVRLYSWNYYPDSITIKNNIFYQECGASYLFGKATNILYENNCYYGAAVNEPPDKKRLNTNPGFLFQEGGAADLKTTIESPCRNSGLEIEKQGGRDYFGNEVPKAGKTDIGAYEADSPDAWSPYETTLAYDIFDDQAVGAQPQAWTGDAGVVGYEGTDNRALRLSAHGEAVRGWQGTGSGLLFVEVKLKPGQNNTESRFVLRDKTASAAVDLTFAADGTIVCNGAPSGKSYRGNQWCQVKILINTQKKEYNVFFEHWSIPVLDGLPFESEGGEMGSVFLNTTEGTLELDDLKVYSAYYAESFQQAKLPENWKQEGEFGSVSVSPEHYLSVANTGSSGENTVAFCDLPRIYRRQVEITCYVRPMQGTVSTQVDILDSNRGQLFAFAFAGGNMLTYKNNGQWIQTGRMYEESQWHQVKVKIDLEKKRCTLYVDDMEAPLLEDMQFTTAASYAVGGFRFIAVNAPVRAEMQIADIVVAPLPEENLPLSGDFSFISDGGSVAGYLELQNYHPARDCRGTLVLAAYVGNALQGVSFSEGNPILTDQGKRILCTSGIPDSPEITYKLFFWDSTKNCNPILNDIKER